MHPMTANTIALQNQHRMLDQAAADRLARVATAGRSSLRARLLAAVRPGTRPATRRSETRRATTGQA